MFGRSSQLRRAAVSVPSNIAEGHGRLSDQLFRVFLAQARGSLFELQTQVTLSADLGFVQRDRSTALLEECTQITMMLNSQ
jgi:four helix bundle protein